MSNRSFLAAPAISATRSLHFFQTHKLSNAWISFAEGTRVAVSAGLRDSLVQKSEPGALHVVVSLLR